MRIIVTSLALFLVCGCGSNRHDIAYEKSKSISGTLNPQEQAKLWHSLLRETTIKNENRVDQKLLIEVNKGVSINLATLKQRDVQMPFELVCSIGSIAIGKITIASSTGIVTFRLSTFPKFIRDGSQLSSFSEELEFQYMLDTDFTLNLKSGIVLTVRISPNNNESSKLRAVDLEFSGNPTLYNN